MNRLTLATSSALASGAHRRFQTSSGRRALLSLLLFLLIAAFAGAQPAFADLRAGVGRAEIVPPPRTPLAGYGGAPLRRMKGIHDPIMAKALVLDDGATRIAIVTTDLIATSPDVKAQVCQRTGFAPERLLLCASHTHSGPGAFAKGLFALIAAGAFDRRVFNLVVDRIAAAVTAAQASLAPARFGTGTVDLPANNRNRRHRGGLTDPQLTVLRVDAAAGAPLAALVHYTAHGTVLGIDNFLASADWMGYTQAALEKATPGLVTLYANGAEGDQSPAPFDDQSGFPRAESIGNAVAAAALTLYRSIATRPSLRIGAVSAMLSLPRTARSIAAGAGRTTFIQAIGLGDTLLTAVPGEMIVELGQRLKEHARERGWRLPLVMGLANDHLGYLLTQAEYAQGGYEARISFFGARFGEDLTAQLEALIDRLAPGMAGKKGRMGEWGNGGTKRAIPVSHSPIHPFSQSPILPRAAAFRAGAGRAELTPPVGTPLAGYADRFGKPSTGSHDPLFAKALVLDDGATRVAIVTTDLIGTHPEIKRQVCQRTGFAPERLLLCASHTHSGPGAFATGFFALMTGAYDQKTFDFLVERIAASVQAAEKGLVPARFGAGSVELPAYNRNRRKGNRVTDPQLDVLRVDTADGKPLAALVHYTAHGTVLGGDNMLASADWMGYTQAAVEKAIPGVIALYANGAEGDQSPGPFDDEKGFQRAGSIGNAVAAGAIDLYRKIEPGPSLRITVALESVPLPDTPGRKLIGAGDTTVVQAIGLNDALLVGLPGEPIVELGLKIKARARERGWKLPLVVGLANDHLGYFLTEAEFKKGGYEARISFFGPTFGDDLTARAEQLVDRLKPPALE